MRCARRTRLRRGRRGMRCHVLLWGPLLRALRGWRACRGRFGSAWYGLFCDFRQGTEYRHSILVFFAAEDDGDVFRQQRDGCFHFGDVVCAVDDDGWFVLHDLETTGRRRVVSTTRVMTSMGTPTSCAAAAARRNCEDDGERARQRRSRTAWEMQRT